jgi:hypothetical protein
MNEHMDSPEDRLAAAQQRLLHSRAHMARWLEHTPAPAGPSAWVYAVQHAMPLLRSPQGQTGVAVMSLLAHWARKHPKSTLLLVGAAALVWWGQRHAARSDSS